MRLFFFGTLMDPEVRALVVGRDVPDEAVEPAVARGFRRVLVAGRPYPMLRLCAAGRVDGIVADGLDSGALRRLRAYEGREYRMRPIRVRSATHQREVVLAFLCRPEVAPGRAGWRLDLWRRRHQRRLLARAQALGVTTRHSFFDRSSLRQAAWAWSSVRPVRRAR